MSNRTLADHPNTRGTAATKDLGSAPDNVPTNAEFNGPTPTEIGRGAIVESGSNANGSYVRWENGDQVCWIKYHAIPYVNPARYTGIWSFPAAFVNNNVSVVSTLGSSVDVESVTGGFSNIGPFASMSSSISASLRVYNAGTNFSETDLAEISFNVTAKGFWK